MAISMANENETAGKGASEKVLSGAKPDVEKIMGDIRRGARERAEEGTKSERDFKADVKKRMLLPLSSRGFTEEFTERIRSRDTARWNIQLTKQAFHGSSFALMRILRWFLTPLTRLLVNLQPAVEQAARQAEINEYHRRLLWATNRDLELTRLEINLIKSELRRLGVNAEFSFSPGSASADAPQRGGHSGRGRSDNRGGRSDRGRGDRRRSDGGRSDRDGGRRSDAGRSDREGGRRSDSGRSDRNGGRRDRQGSGQGSRQTGGQPARQDSRQGPRPNRGGSRRPSNGGAPADNSPADKSPGDKSPGDKSRGDK